MHFTLVYEIWNVSLLIWIGIFKIIISNYLFGILETITVLHYRLLKKHITGNEPSGKFPRSEKFSPEHFLRYYLYGYYFSTVLCQNIVFLSYN